MVPSKTKRTLCFHFLFGIVLALHLGCTPPEFYRGPVDVDVLILGDSTIHTMLESETNGTIWKSVFPALVTQSLVKPDILTHQELYNDLVASAENYQAGWQPRMVVLSIGSEEAGQVASKDPSNNYQDFFDTLQDDLANGTASGIDIEMITDQILSLWPTTHILIVNPTPTLWNYQERVFINNWESYNNKVQALANNSNISFLDAHSTLVDIYYEQSTNTFQHLNELDSALLVSQWAGWAEFDEYALFESAFQSTHEDSVHLNFYGAMIFTKLLKCPINEVVNNNNFNYQCGAITTSQLNDLQYATTYKDIVLFGDSVMNSLPTSSAWKTVFHNYNWKNLSDGGQDHEELMADLLKNEKLYKLTLKPTVVLINNGLTAWINHHLEWDVSAEDAFLKKQDEVANGIYSGISIEDVTNKILEMWPNTQILLLNPYPRISGFDQRVLLTNWDIFNAKAQSMAAHPQVSFIDTHYAFSQIYKSRTPDEFAWLDDIEPGIVISEALSWTEDNEYDRLRMIWYRTHRDSVHFNQSGYMIYTKLLECPMKALVDDGDSNYNCPSITPTDVNALRSSME